MTAQSTTDTSAAAAGRAAWPPLPRRAGPRWTLPLHAIRLPIPPVATWTLTVLSIVVPVAAWAVLSATGSVSERFLPSPLTVWAAGVEFARTGTLLTDISASMTRIFYGFGLAILVSVPLGILMGTFRSWHAFLEPITGLFRYLPATAFGPLLMIWVGIEEAPKIALIFIGTVFFNLLMTTDVVKNVPYTLIDVSYTLGARRLEVMRKVIVPHSLPGMIDAIRVNAAAAFALLIVAEVISPADAGLGKRIYLAFRFQEADEVFAMLVVIGVLGYAIDIALRLIRDRVGRWAT